MKFKKILCSVLVITMVLSTMNFSVFADTADLEISTVQELLAFASTVNDGNTFEGKTVVLTSGLDLTGTDWLPIGNGTRNSATYSGNAFKGIFDGQNNTINGLTINDALSGDATSGFFGVVSNGTVKNVNFTNMSITTNATNTGAIGLAVDGATIENIVVGTADDASVVNCPDGAAGVLGRLCGSGTINNCVNYADVISQASNGGVGGIVGKAYRPDSADSMSVTNCINYGNIECGYAAGGIVGLSATNVTNCKNYGTVTAGAEAGGIIGEQNNPTGNNLSISGNINEGNVNVTSPEKLGAGGIIGQAKTQCVNGELLLITNNVNSGNITVDGTTEGANATDAGGIVGYLYMTDAVIRGNKNTSDIIVAPGYAGAIVGLVYQHTDGNTSGDDVTISNNVNTSTTVSTVGSSNGSNHIIENNGTAFVAKIGDAEYVNLDEALTAANSIAGTVEVEIYDKVTLNKSFNGSYDSIKFVGKNDSAEIYLDIQGYITAEGKNVIFEDLKLSKSPGGYIGNAGFMNVAFGVYTANTISYNNCIFLNGAYAAAGKTNFTDCTFYRSYDRYGLWAYGDVDCTVEGCTFADIRGVKMYAEGAAKVTNLTVKNTDFSVVTDKPAIVLTYGESVTLEGNSYSDTGVFELDLDGKPNGTTVTSDVPPTCINDNGACGVLVDGKIYTTVADAAAVVEDGSTVSLLHDTNEAVDFEKDVILETNGYNAPNVKLPVAKIGNTCYISIQAAIEATSDGNEIDIVDDIAVEDTITITKNVTIDLNGNTISAVADNGAVVLMAAGDGVVFNVTDGTLTLTDSEGTGMVSTTGDAIFEVSGNGSVAITGGLYSHDVSTYAAEGYVGTQNEYGYYTVVADDATVDSAASKVTENVSVRFDKKSETQYDVVLVADSDAQIHRFLSAELDIQVASDSSTINLYSVEGNSAYGIEVIDPLYNDSGVWGFHLDDKAINATGNEIVIGTVTIAGYGAGKLSIKANENNKVEAIESVANNNVKKYSADLGNFAIPAKAEDVFVTVPTKKLTIKVTFPNAIAESEKAYQKMHVNVSGKDIADIDLDLGSDGDFALNADGQYVIEIADALTLNNSYNITLTGAGYRTAKYRVTMTDDKTVYFWNDAVKGEAIAFEEGGTVKAKTSFLAGDIAEDNIIDKYDLAAVVSYFGKYGLKADKELYKYAKYDLNRDGKIDSEDIAYVLASFGY